MSINFNRWYPLLFLIPVALLMWGTYRRFLSKQYIRSTIFRSLTIVLIILSMCGVHLLQSAKETTTVFLVDKSHSTADSLERMEAFIDDAITYKGEDDLVGIVTFGSESMVEMTPSLAPVYSGIESRIDGEFTNIQTGVISANALIPSDTKRRIVLLSDGYENIGDGRKQMGSLPSGGTVLDIVDYSEHNFSEVQFESLTVPDKVEKNQTIEVKSTIISNVETTGTLYVYSNNQVKFEKLVDLDEGDNQFVFTDTITDSGLVTYSAQIIVDKDSYVENNHVSTFTFVNDLPKLLIIQDDDEAALNLIGMLEGSADLDIKPSLEAPTPLEQLIKYDGYIISNVAIDRMDPELLVNMEEAIRLQGKGLLVTGGETSFGPGGYYKTLLEDMLPVNMDSKPKEEKPNLGLMLVIDKSGSMGGGEYGVSQMELAKEAAIRSLEVLEENDYIGVLGFDSLPKWVVEPVLAVDKEHIETQIASLGPGGGTSIQPSLEEAIKELELIDTGLKHIILLTDGQAETTGYLPLIERMNEEGITLSTVAVGMGADKNLLQLLAEYGNGRYYETDVFSDIPSIFTKEAFMAGKKYLNNVTFYPRLTGDSPIVNGVAAIPELDGYVATSAKDQGKVVLSGPDNDPILASWQYGLGRTIAYTSDMKGLWSSKWLAWENNQNFWINTVSWMVQQDLNRDYAVNGYYENGLGIIEVNSLVKSEDYSSMEGLLSGPAGSSDILTLEATAPGKYKGTFEPNGEGVYLVSLKLGEGEGAEQIITAVNIGYSKEYDFFSGDRISGEEVIAITGGRLLTQARDVFKGQLPEVSGSRDLSMVFIILAFLMFMFEIIFRKFKPPVKTVGDAMKSQGALVRDRFKKKEKREKEGGYTDELLKGKNNVKKN